MQPGSRQILVTQSHVDAFYQTTQEPSPLRRPYLGVMFECCSVYARVYRRSDQKAYIARCPRCLRAARVRVGPDGSQQRFLIAR